MTSFKKKELKESLESFSDKELCRRYAKEEKGSEEVRTAIRDILKEREAKGEMNWLVKRGILGRSSEYNAFFISVLLIFAWIINKDVSRYILEVIPFIMIFMIPGFLVSIYAILTEKKLSIGLKHIISIYLSIINLALGYVSFDLLRDGKISILFLIIPAINLIWSSLTFLVIQGYEELSSLLFSDKNGKSLILIISACLSILIFLIGDNILNYHWAISISSSLFITNLSIKTLEKYI